MKLTVFNCSPKPGKNNTQVMLESMMGGFSQTSGNTVTVHKLNRLTDVREAAALFAQAEAVLIAFPLYCYAMPGGVKELFEELEPLCNSCGGKKLGFMVQYGFREAIHARPLEQYLKRLSAMLGCEYIGTVIKGGCDNLGNAKNKEILEGVCALGKTLGETGKFSQAALDAYSAPETSKKKSLWLMKLILRIINRVYWKKSMEKNGVSEQESFARPYMIK